MTRITKKPGLFSALIALTITAAYVLLMRFGESTSPDELPMMAPHGAEIAVSAFILTMIFAVIWLITWLVVRNRTHKA